MAQWLYNRRGKATLIDDEDCIRDRAGRVIAWISGNNIYLRSGRHAGWYEEGVLFDRENKALGSSSIYTGNRRRTGDAGVYGTAQSTGIFRRSWAAWAWRLVFARARGLLRFVVSWFTGKRCRARS